MIIIKNMFDRMIYLNDNCPPRNQYVLTNCVNIINEIYKDLRSKYHIPFYIDKENVFNMYLNDNDDVDEIYTNDLPEVCKNILNGCNGLYPDFLNKRIEKLKYFFNME